MFGLATMRYTRGQSRLTGKPRRYNMACNNLKRKSLSISVRFYHTPFGDDGIHDMSERKGTRHEIAGQV